MLSHGVKYREKITANYNSLDKIYPIKGLYSTCQKGMDKFLDPCFDILIN